jgi:hypothetical protein
MDKAGEEIFLAEERKEPLRSVILSQSCYQPPPAVTSTSEL